MHRHQLKAADALAFMLAGNAILTALNTETGNRFTFKVRKPKALENMHFVSVLTGADNEGDYTFLGTIFTAKQYYHGKKSRIGADAQSAKVFPWIFQHILDDTLPDNIEIWHEGRCGACGRVLTVPESIEAGIGPKCATRIIQYQPAAA